MSRTASPSARRHLQMTQISVWSVDNRDMEIALGIVMLIGLALGAGVVAEAKGHSFFGFVVIALFLPLMGGLMALGMPVDQDALDARAIKRHRRQRCSYCKEIVRIGATKCPSCQSEFIDLDSDYARSLEADRLMAAA